MVLGWWGLKTLGLGWSDLTPQHVRNRVLAFGVWAPAAYLVLFGQPLVPLPASIIIMAGGLAFGPLWGTLAGLGGATVRACVQFGLARWLGRERIAKGFTGRLGAFHDAVGEHGLHAVLLVRLISNLPFDLQNYGLAFSRVRFVPYGVGTALGLLPGTVAFVCLGDSLTDPKQRWKFLLAVLLIAGLVIGQLAWKLRARRQPTA